MEVLMLMVGMLQIIVDGQRQKSKRIIEGIAERTRAKCVHLMK